MVEPVPALVPHRPTMAGLVWDGWGPEAALEVPLVQLRGVLLVYLQTELGDSAIERLQRRILERLAASKVKGLLLDVTGVPVVDSYFSRMLCETAWMARLMGVPTVLVGLQPAVAVTLAELGLDFPGIHVEMDLERGLAWLERRARARSVPRDHRSRL